MFLECSVADANITQLKRLVEAAAQTFSRDTDIVNVFCLTCSYARCDELIWVKTNQLQRLIRTGRTGHWLNHGKEHCLVRWCFWFISVVDILVWSKNCFFCVFDPFDSVHHLVSNSNSFYLQTWRNKETGSICLQLVKQNIFFQQQWKLHIETVIPLSYFNMLLSVSFTSYFSVVARSNVHIWRLKLHVLQVGVKGDCKNFNRGLDCDVLVAEVCSCT